MAFIQTTPVKEAVGKTQDMYLWQQKSYGYVPNYAKVFCYRPEIMGLWADLQRGIRANLSDRSFELVTLAAALELKSSNCSLAHGGQLQKLFSDADLKEIVGHKCEGIISEAEEVMVRFAAKVARDAISTTQADIDELKTVGYADAEIFDITATAAARAFWTKVIDGLGVMTDHDYAEMDSSLKGMLSVGGLPTAGVQEVV